MFNRHDFLLRVFTYITAFTAGLGFGLEPASMTKLATAWSCYLLLHTVVAVMRLGWRGFAAPTVALILMGLAHWVILGPLCIAVWLAALVLSLCVLFGKRAMLAALAYAKWRISGRARAARGYVSVLLPAAKTDVDAGEVLSRLGLGGH